MLLNSFSFQTKTDHHRSMSHSPDQTSVLDWPVLVLLAVLVLGAIAVMLKLTVGSCYKPPSVADRYHERKET